MTINKKLTLENRRISELCAPLRLIFGYDAGLGCNVEWLRKIFETLNFYHSPGARNIFTVFRKLRILHVVELPNFGLWALRMEYYTNSEQSHCYLICSRCGLRWDHLPKAWGENTAHNKPMLHSRVASSTQTHTFSSVFELELRFQTLSISVRVLQNVVSHCL